MKGFEDMNFDHNRLREARLKKNWTLEEMANLMNMDLAAYWRLEKGKTKVKAEQLIMFMKFFDQPYIYFFETNTHLRTITFEVECIPEKMQVMYKFLKNHPDIVKGWEETKLKVEQELYPTCIDKNEKILLKNTE
ncbi:helix-turn-helix domain-containing protein [Oceanobacillus sojae]|uniref:helix-turn-helix domain-containing protein n=1 Tax=Oceanobacillus sojae TaxID=582851 RepID=UPI0036D2A76A